MSHGVVLYNGFYSLRLSRSGEALLQKIPFYCTPCCGLSTVASDGVQGRSAYSITALREASQEVAPAGAVLQLRPQLSFFFMCWQVKLLLEETEKKRKADEAASHLLNVSQRGSLDVTKFVSYYCM